MPDSPSLLPIDVIIPTWGEHYAKALPRSLASANRAAQRTVVGDDVAREIGLANGATHVIELQEKHPGPARVQAIEVATQPYVLFMDVDDELLPGALDLLYDELQKHPKAVGVAGYFVRSNDDSLWPKPWQARLATSPVGLYWLLFKNTLPTNGSLLIRRDRIPTHTPPFHLSDE